MSWSFCVLRSSSFLRSASRPPSLCQQAARPPSSSSPSTSSISCSFSTFSFLRPPSLCQQATNRGIYLTRGAYRQKKKKKDPTALDGEQQQQQRQQPHHEIDVRNISANNVMRDVAGSGGGARTRLEGVDNRDGVIRLTKDDSRRKSGSPAPQNPSSSSHQHSSSTSSHQQPSSQHTSPPVSAKIKIDSLIETIRVRREQASRTLLIVPDLSQATNPCPRYMRHKIESYVGRVRHVALTSVVASSKTDAGFGIASPASAAVDGKMKRKSLLVEFRDEDQMRELIHNFSRQFPNDKVSFNYRLLYRQGKWSQSTTAATDVELKDDLNACANISEQMETLLRRTELDDASVRTRFFLCDVIESLIEAIFPGCKLIPFGSTLSGLGRADSDMDITMTLTNPNSHKPPPIGSTDLPFMPFSTRLHDVTDSRAIVIRQLTLIHEIMRTALPGYCEYTRIFRANVPIITFKHSYTNLCCDLSIQSTDSILAAQLFYAYTLLDPRVRPYLFALRRWTIVQGLSSFVTNFPLCCLALFYLMEAKVVPPMDLVLECGKFGDAVIPTAVTWEAKDADASLEDLLVGFFDYYASFDFDRDAISVFQGKKRPKVTSEIIEVENPLDRELNCARLIDHSKGTATFKAAITAAAESLKAKPTPASAAAVAEAAPADAAAPADITAVADAMHLSPADAAAEESDDSHRNWGLTLLIESRPKSTEVFVDDGDPATVDSDGDFGGGLFAQRHHRTNNNNNNNSINNNNNTDNHQANQTDPNGKNAQVSAILEEIFAEQQQQQLLQQEQARERQQQKQENEFSLNPVRFL